jgi:hypothetical protein
MGPRGDGISLMIDVWSLNGARFAGSTATEVPPTLQWLSSLAAPGAVLPDVLCLQDVRIGVLETLVSLPYFHFAPMTNAMYFGRRELVGICIASRWPITGIDVMETWGDGIVRDLEGVDQNNDRIAPLDLSDRMVLRTQNRVAIACTITKPGDAVPYRIATHHGFWTRDGAVSPEQLESTRKVAAFLESQGRQHGGILYMADYNPDKFGNVYDLYRASGGYDWLPPEIPTTLAPKHPAAQLGIRSDCVMTWPDEQGRYSYRVPMVRVNASPGSDHLLLCASVEVQQMHGKDR